MAKTIIGRSPGKNCSLTMCISYAPRAPVSALRCSGFASLLAQLNHILPARESSATPQLRSNGRAKRQMHTPLGASLFRTFVVVFVRRPGAQKNSIILENSISRILERRPRRGDKDAMDSKVG